MKITDGVSIKLQSNETVGIRLVKINTIDPKRYFVLPGVLQQQTLQEASIATLFNAKVQDISSKLASVNQTEGKSSGKYVPPQDLLQGDSKLTGSINSPGTDLLCRRETVCHPVVLPQTNEEIEVIVQAAPNLSKYVYIYLNVSMVTTYERYFTLIYF